MAPSNASEEKRHPFGGCNKLLNDYRTIGSELQQYEKSTRIYGYSFAAFSAFREGVVFVPMEALESYLEDLLDVETSEDRLFIGRQTRHFGLPLFCAAGLCSALAAGLYAGSAGASETFSLAVALCIAAPFVLLWHFYPRGTVTRRLLFARVLSQEISRRRGKDKDGGFAFQDLLGRKRAGTMHGAARQAIEVLH